MIVQGPAEVELQSQSSAVLQSGSLTTEVSTAARGFSIHTPNSTVVDQGTKFGVACRAGQTDVEVFVGSVIVRLNDAQSGVARQELPLAANSAVRVNGVPGQGALKIETLASGSRHFVQSLTGSGAQLQALVENDPHLIHFYPFEGATNTERLHDRRGNLDLHEVTMRDGDGGGRLEFANGPRSNYRSCGSLPADIVERGPRPWLAVRSGIPSAGSHDRRTPAESLTHRQEP